MSKYDKAGLAMIPSGYKASKVYSLIPNSSDGDFDFSRASTATRVNKDGLIETVATNVPRLEYPLIDGVVQDTPSLLLEPSRTNLVTYSEDFSDSSWAKQSNGTGTAPVVTSNDAISPDGTQNADKVVFDKGSGSSTSDLSILSASFTSQANTASFYVKADSPQRIVVRNSGSFVGYDITTEWTRIEKTDSGGSFQIGLRDGYGVSDVPDTATIYLWGAQVEGASYATSYIPTSGSTVTRSAEVCNGAGTSAEFNDSEGVLYANIASLNDADTSSRRLGLTKNGTFEGVRIQYNGSTIGAVLYDGTTNQYSQTFTFKLSLFAKVAFKYKASDFALWINGFEYGAQASGTTFSEGTLDDLSFDYVNSNFFYAKTKQLMTFNEALTDAELEDLTSWDSFSEMAKAQQYQRV